MKLLSRKACLALMLLLLLSHAALTLHVTTHIPVDQSNCEYCSGNANPAHAIPTPLAELPRVPAKAIEIEAGAPPLHMTRRVHYRERAPPVLV